MAGDWIKFEKATLDKPEVFQIACELDIDPDAVVGKLLRVWDWFDEHSEDGNATVTVKALLNRKVGVSGFLEAMENVDWLAIEDDIMTLPNFDRHNGSTAKKRCSTNRRVSKSRAKNDNGNTQSVTGVTPEALQKALPEKRREEKRRKDTTVETPAIAWSSTGGWVGISDQDREDWREAYPACDIDRQLAVMNQWLKANPSKAKKKLWRRFITNWLQRDQERGGAIKSKPINFAEQKREMAQESSPL